VSHTQQCLLADIPRRFTCPRAVSHPSK